MSCLEVSSVQECPHREREVPLYSYYCRVYIHIIYMLQKLISYTCKLRVTYIGPPDIFCRDYIYISCTYVMV